MTSLLVPTVRAPSAAVKSRARVALPALGEIGGRVAPLPTRSRLESSRRGVAILPLPCLVQFMGVLDASILNIALPSIKRDLGFSHQHAYLLRAREGAD